MCNLTADNNFIFIYSCITLATITCAIFKLLIIRFFLSSWYCNLYIYYNFASLTIKWVMLRREIMDGKTEQLPKWIPLQFLWEEFFCCFLFLFLTSLIPKLACVAFFFVSVFFFGFSSLPCNYLLESFGLITDCYCNNLTIKNSLQLNAVHLYMCCLYYLVE